MYEEMIEDYKFIGEEKRDDDLAEASAEALAGIMEHIAKSPRPANAMKQISWQAGIGQSFLIIMEAAIESLADDIRSEQEGEQSQSEMDAENLALDTAARVRDMNGGGL